MPPQPPSSQNRPTDYPLVYDTPSLLALFGLALTAPLVLWALADPVRIAGIATVVCAVVLFVRGARRVHRADRAFHVPGTGFDVEISVRRTSQH
ncbi:hypothetical protein [Halocatena pleomorpha]|uniref:Uncharacterized protein n=1 Tax=Halocatena pleomorpha TaxID=1785090 RepID=A0A3P3REA4_9EURY|nr:hypothetical protein [Halocatena pleomorpha]RRJ31288.1 hypothetical protein EIK79_07780 [Halocatena pleomorpha]